MKTMLALALLAAPATGHAAVAGSAADVGPDPLAAETIHGGTVATLPPAAADPAWDALPATTVTIVAQRTVRLGDREANAALAASRPLEIEVRAAATARELAVRLSWPDASENRADPRETNVFGDAAAMQVPQRFGTGQRLPYVGMGDAAAPVRVYLRRAGPTAGVTGLDPAAGEYLAAGFGSLTRAAERHASGDLRYDPARRIWHASFRRPLKAGGSDLAAGLVPVAFAIWDGSSSERGGNKRLSGWKLLRLSGFAVDATYARELAAAFSPERAGSAARGRDLAAGACAGCHSFGPTGTGRGAGPPAGGPAIGPDLSGIGAIATYGYLRDSLRNPGQVVLRRPGWHAAGQSIMPGFSGLAAQDVADLVAYLKTLDGKQEGRK